MHLERTVRNIFQSYICDRSLPLINLVPVITTRCEGIQAPLVDDHIAHPVQHPAEGSTHPPSTVTHGNHSKKKKKKSNKVWVIYKMLWAMGGITTLPLQICALLGHSPNAFLNLILSLGNINRCVWNEIMVF